MMNNTVQRKAGALLTYLYIVVNTLIVLLYQPLALRILGKSEYGLYQLVSSVMNYLSVMDLGFGNGIVVYTAKYHAMGKYEQEKKLHGMFFLIFCGISILVCCAGVGITLNVEHIFKALTAEELAKGKILLSILTVNMTATFVFSIYGNIIVANEKFIFAKLINIIRVLLTPLIIVPLLLLGADSIAMVTVLSVVNIITLIANAVFCKVKLGVTVRYSGFDKHIFKEIFSYSIFVFIAEIVDKVNWYVDQAILGIVRGTDEVAVYSMASNYNQMALQLSSVFSSIVLPKVSKMVAKNESDKALSDEFIKTSRLQFMTIFLFVTGFIMLGHKFVIWHVGKGCEAAYYIAVVLIIGSAIPITQSVGISIMKAKNLFYIRTFLLLGMAVANIAVSVPLAIKLGGFGSALGTTVSILIANVVIINIYYQKKCGIDVVGYWKTVLIMMLKYSPAIIITLVLKYTLKLQGMTEFFVLGFLYTGLYIVISLFFVMNDYEKDTLKKIIGKVTGIIRRTDR